MLSRLVIVMLLLLMTATQVFAGNVTFIKEYTYRASDMDSKVSSRAIALDQVKRLLLEELGTYLMSETEVINYQITKDQITSLTAGIVMTSIIDERWDGKDYYLKAKIVADPKEVEKSVDSLRRDKENSRELEVAKKKAEAALQEVDKLRKALVSGKSSAAQQQDYDKAINNITANELFYKGFALLNAKNYKEAINIFSQAIALEPKSVEAYNNRGLAYNQLGLYKNAFDDYNRALSYDSRNVKTYLLRGIVCENLNMGEKVTVDNYQKAIQIDSTNADAYYYLGSYYLNCYKLGPTQGCSSPGETYLMAYYDHDHIRMPAENAWEGYRHVYLAKRIIYNYQIAARLGHRKAQDFLRSQSISW